MVTCGRIRRCAVSSTSTPLLIERGGVRGGRAAQRLQRLTGSRRGLRRAPDPAHTFSGCSSSWPAARRSAHPAGQGVLRAVTLQAGPAYSAAQLRSHVLLAALSSEGLAVMQMACSLPVTSGQSRPVAPPSVR